MDTTELEEDEIYDEGISITNRVAITGIKSIFEAPVTGPKPKIQTKPVNKFFNTSPRNDGNNNQSMNGDVPNLPSKGTQMQSKTIETEPADSTPKRNSKLNIPDVFAKNDSPKPSPKPPPKPGAVKPWVKKCEENNESQNEKSEIDKKVVTPNLPEKPSWANRQRKQDETTPENPPDHKLTWSERQALKAKNSPDSNSVSRKQDETTPEKPPGKLTWSERQALLKAKNSPDSNSVSRKQDETTPEKPPAKLTWSERQALLKAKNSPDSTNVSSEKSTTELTKDIISESTPKKKPSVLRKYNIQELEGKVGGTPKPKGLVSPKIEEKEPPNLETENEKTSPGRPSKPGIPFVGITSDMNINSLKNKLRHVEPKTHVNLINKDGEKVNLRDKPGDGSSNQRKSFIRKSVTRHADDKKFHAVEFSDKNSSLKPKKPPKLSAAEIDLDKIIANHQALLSDLGSDTAALQSGVSEEDEELYEPIPADEDDVPLRQSTSRSSRAVSLIQPMTEDEEFDQDQEEYEECETKPPARPELPNLPSLPELPNSIPPARPPKFAPPAVPAEDLIQEEEYNDCETAYQAEDLEQDDVYEPLDELNEAVQQLDNNKPVENEVKKEETVEEKKDGALSEKERKKKEKEEQKRKEEEKKKHEKELKELKKKFKIEPYHLQDTQGEGNIRNNAKGKGLDLTVKTGQRVVMIRLNLNPKGKWLVKLKQEGKYGYVDANNVEVDNSIIRNVMEGSYVNMTQLSFGENASANQDIQEEYADVEVQEEYADADVADQEEYADAEVLEQDDMYEDC